MHRRITKRLLACLLILMMVTALIPLTVWAQNGSTDTSAVSSTDTAATGKTIDTGAAATATEKTIDNGTMAIDNDTVSSSDVDAADDESDVEYDAILTLGAPSLIPNDGSIVDMPLSVDAGSFDGIQATLYFAYDGFYPDEEGAAGELVSFQYLNDHGNWEDLSNTNDTEYMIEYPALGDDTIQLRASFDGAGSYGFFFYLVDETTGAWMYYDYVFVQVIDRETIPKGNIAGYSLHDDPDLPISVDIDGIEADEFVSVMLLYDIDLLTSSDVTMPEIAANMSSATVPFYFTGGEFGDWWIAPWNPHVDYAPTEIHLYVDGYKVDEMKLFISDEEWADLPATTDKSISATFHFDANGGKNAPDSITLSSETGSIQVIFPAEVPTRSGYTFAGWEVAKVDYDPDAIYCQPGEEYGFYMLDNEELTFYAVWKKNAASSGSDDDSTSGDDKDTTDKDTTDKDTADKNTTTGSSVKTGDNGIIATIAVSALVLSGAAAAYFVFRRRTAAEEN